MTKSEIETNWTNAAIKALVGRKIVAVEYLSKETCDALDWWESGVVLILDNGSEVLVQADDEGNGPGALNILSKTGEFLIPTISKGHVS
jgi:hypothetical protein